MKKITTLFKKDPNDLGRVIDKVNPGNEWVFEGKGIPTRKFDGTACAIIKGKLYKRYDIKLFKKKKGRLVIFTKEQIKSKTPEVAISCQEPDKITGHWPHWVLCDRNKPEDKYHFEGFDAYVDYEINVMKNKDLDGTYELCGPKIQGNPEKLHNNILIKHGSVMIEKLKSYSYCDIMEYLTKNDIEGIVFHHKDDNLQGRMCKIRKLDFGIKR